MQTLMRWAVAALLAFVVPAHGQSFDLATSVSASRSSELRVGDVVTVSISVRNRGPGDAQAFYVGGSQGTGGPYFFESLGVQEVACGSYLPSELDPPGPEFMWRIEALAAGSDVVCSFSIRLIRVPSDLAGRIEVRAGASMDSFDGNNSAVLALAFAEPRSPRSVPAASWWAIILAAACLAWVGRTRVASSDGSSNER